MLVHPSLCLLYKPSSSWRKSGRLIGRFQNRIKASGDLAGNTTRGEENTGQNLPRGLR